MSRSVLLIDAGAAETRVARTIDGVVRGFWFGAAEGDGAEASPPLGVGDIVTGRVVDLAPALGGAFIDLGADGRGFLTAKRAQTKLVEGAPIVVRVRRDSDGRKAVELDGDWRAGLCDEARRRVEAAVRVTERIGRIDPFDTAAERALRVWPDDRADIVGPGQADVAWTDEIEATLEASLQRALRAGDAVFTFDETEVGAMVDVDRTADARVARGRGELAFIETAAAFLAAELDRRAIGGIVGVDFPAISEAEERKRLSRLARTFGRVEDAGRDGFVRVTRPRRHRSLLACATEIAPDAPETARPGRQFTLDWRAKAALRALEMRLRRRPSARLELRAPEEIVSYIEDRPHWADRLVARFGARFDVVQTERKGEARHDIVEL